MKFTLGASAGVSQIGSLRGERHQNVVAPHARNQRPIIKCNADRYWLEYVDWTDTVLETQLRISDGKVDAARFGSSGIVWDDAKVDRLDSL